MQAPPVERVAKDVANEQNLSFGQSFAIGVTEITLRKSSLDPTDNVRISLGAHLAHVKLRQGLETVDSVTVDSTNEDELRGAIEQMAARI